VLLVNVREDGRRRRELEGGLREVERMLKGGRRGGYGLKGG
jgi:hypothetical protein